MKNLEGLHVLVTRPSPGGEALCQVIQEAGGVALHFPTIVFAPPHDLHEFQAVLTNINHQDWLIFVSPQAVVASIPAIRRDWPNLPASVRLAAVGEGTAKALAAAGYIVSVYPKENWSSEGLLNLPDFQHLLGKKITIVRGEGGRELLATVLTARDATVSHLIAYRRTLPNVDVSVCCKQLIEHNIDVIVCTSYDGVRNFKSLIGEATFALARSVPLLVVGERVKMLAQDLGFQTIWVARHASHEAILAVLIEKRGE